MRTAAAEGGGHDLVAGDVGQDVAHGHVDAAAEGGAVGVEVHGQRVQRRAEHTDVRAATGTGGGDDLLAGAVGIEFADGHGVAATEADPVRRDRLGGRAGLEAAVQASPAIGDRHAASDELRRDRVGRRFEALRHEQRRGGGREGRRHRGAAGVSVATADQRGE